MTRITASARPVLRFRPDKAASLYRLYRGAVGGGAVSYAAAVGEAEAWPDGVALGGFGTGPFGSGLFGIGPGGPGFGYGPMGYGPFGLGCHAVTWTGPALPDGVYQFAAVGVDAAGNAGVSPAAVEATVTIAGEPQAPGTPRATSYVEGTDTLTVTWALSGDDR